MPQQRAAAAEQAQRAAPTGRRRRGRVRRRAQDARVERRRRLARRQRAQDPRELALVGSSASVGVGRPVHAFNRCRNLSIA
jgi:hypothetical protein